MPSLCLVDTSVWVEFFRGVQSPHTRKLEQIFKDGDCCICDVVLLEVLRGFESDKDFNVANRLLSSLPFFESGGRETALAAVSIHRSLRRRGFTIRSSIDCMIAAVAIDNELPLLANDRDYLPFARYLNLSLVIGA